MRQNTTMTSNLIEVHSTYVAGCRISPSGLSVMNQRRWQLNCLYNRALYERKKIWESEKRGITYNDQCKWLTGLRKENWMELGEFALGPQRGMLDRLDRAFKSFFRRVKKGENPGYPRFRPLSRCVTIDVTKFTQKVIKNRGHWYAVKIKGFPLIRIRKSRELPLDRPLKALRFTLRNGRWECSAVYALEKTHLPANDKTVGLDLGVRKRVTLSDGTIYPRSTRDDRKHRVLQRAISRSKKGSKTRRKRVQTYSRFRRRESVRDRNEVHRITTDIVRNHGTINVEALKIKNMTASAKGTVEEPGKNVKAKSGLNREILKQNWGLLRDQLKYKAEWAGREYVEIDPRYTSQTCNRCGERTNPGSSETYRCQTCELVEDRDLNAALNIMTAGDLAVESLTQGITPYVDLESCIYSGI